MNNTVIFYLLLFSISLATAKGQSRDTINSSSSFGIELSLGYRKISEAGLGFNFMHKPNWNKNGPIYSMSYEGFVLFPTTPIKFGNRLNIDLAYWKKRKKFMPNAGASLETFNYSKYNLGLRIGITHLNFVFINYQFTLPLNYSILEYVGTHGISLVFKLNWMIPEIGYNTF